jgi:Carbohydrate binding module (family 6)/PLD-like domain
MYRPFKAFTFATLVTLGFSFSAAAQTVPGEWLCDTQFEDCREPLLNLIRQETQGIDVAFWFMEDARFANELVKRHQAGVPVRVLVDQRANASKRLNETMLNTLRNAGVPMREKYTGGDILHFKMMLFHGQNMLEFSKANYTGISFVPVTPNVNYFDEAIFFTNDANLLNSFLKRFEDLWTNTSQYRNFANITQPLTRTCPDCTIHSSMNFPPIQNFSSRSVGRYNAETQAIDAIVYRVTDHRHADAMIAAVNRGVPVRIIIEPDEYRNPVRVWVGKHVDRMFMGGVQLKIRKHQGLTHEAAVVMHGLGEVIFGSSNWTTTSALYQDEHNYFYKPSLGKPWFFQFFADQFENKWNDTVNYAPFKPLPPTSPSYKSPVNVSTGVGSSVTLTWDGGPWSHLYDIYFGTTPNPPLLKEKVELGSPEEGVLEKYVVPDLLPGTTYYWRVVGRTWADLTNSGPTWSFTTAGTAPGGGSTPYGGTAAALPGTFQAENFDDGGISVAYLDTTTGNSGNAYRPTDVDIQATTDIGGGYNVGWTKAGEWLKYTVNVGATGTYTLETRVANVGAGATFRIEVDGVDRSGPIAIPNTGAWQTWQTISTRGIPLTAGQRVLRIVLLTASSSGAGNFNWFRLTADSSPPSTTAYGGTPASLPGIVQAENFDMGANGVAYYDTAAGNSGAAYRQTDVDIGTTNDSSNGGYQVGWTRAGEWLTYSVNATEGRDYTLSVRVANVGTGATFRVEVDGSDRTGAVPVPDTGGWDVWQTLAVGAISLSEGPHVIRLVIVSRNTQNSGAGNYGYLRFQ